MHSSHCCVFWTFYSVSIECNRNIKLHLQWIYHRKALEVVKCLHNMSRWGLASFGYELVGLFCIHVVQFISFKLSWFDAKVYGLPDWHSMGALQHDEAKMFVISQSSIKCCISSFTSFIVPQLPPNYFFGRVQELKTSMATKLRLNHIQINFQR